MTSRCRANVHALRFTKPIQEVGQKLGTRMREMAKRFIAVHLRDQMDWDTFARKMKAVQRGFMGEPDEMRPGRRSKEEDPVRSQGG
ncbi:hypothetical protein V6N12_038333 [Hibiscus sabdariffa]|uniref:O-fucosyltransferase family protein n=1 Tax=Hibiscus sabdariffa TaxID=183260 RepID=A0ABR2BEM5_9ROSI